MDEYAGVVQWRQRATALVNETNIPYSALMAAMPALMVTGAEFAGALRHFSQINLKDNQQKVLVTLQERAEQRIELLRKRFNTSNSNIAAMHRIDNLNYRIAGVQFAITAGKSAELALSCFAWWTKVKTALDRGKMVLDTLKGAMPMITESAKVLEGGRPSSSSNTLAVASLAATAGRQIEPFAQIAKLIYDGVSTIRRARSASNIYAGLSMLLNGMKTAFDVIRLYMEKADAALTQFGGPFADGVQGNKIAGPFAPDITAMKTLSSALVILRDAIDTGIAFYRLGESILALRRNQEAIELQIEMRDRFVGTDRDAIHEVAGSEPLEEHQIDRVIEMSGNLATAEAVVRESLETQLRLKREIEAAVVFHWQQGRRVAAMFVEFKPLLDELEVLLERLTTQIDALGWDADRDAVHATGYRTIQESLIGYRAVVNTACCQAYAVLTQH